MVTVKRSNKSEAKTAQMRLRRETAKRVRPHGWARRFGVVAIEKANGKKKSRLMAVITTGASVFFDPLSALRKQLDDGADPTKQSGPVRKLQPAEASETVFETGKRRTHHCVHHRSFAKRARQMGGYWLRMWKTKHPLPYGYFFLYPDRVVLHTWTQEKGFKVQRVPTEGMP